MRGYVVLNTILVALSAMSATFNIELMVPNPEPAALSSGPTALSPGPVVFIRVLSTQYDACSTQLRAYSAQCSVVTIIYSCVYYSLFSRYLFMIIYIMLVFLKPLSNISLSFLGYVASLHLQYFVESSLQRRQAEHSEVE